MGTTESFEIRSVLVRLMDEENSRVSYRIGAPDKDGNIVSRIEIQVDRGLVLIAYENNQAVIRPWGLVTAVFGRLVQQEAPQGNQG